TVTVTGVTRASDASPLQVSTASFSHTSFNVASAASLSSRSLRVTFDAAPNAAQATSLASYSVGGLTLSGTPVLAGNTVTLTTSAQSAMTYTISVTGITRAADGTVLTTAAAAFTGRAPFEVASAASTSNGSITVTFSAPPTASEATTLASYSVPGLVLSGTPVLSGNIVTLSTSAQTAQTHTVMVSGVTRAADSEPLSSATASFTGTPIKAPTVTNVVVQATTPSNGTTFYNTGTATIVITGTDFASVSCPAGVELDDANGAGVVVATTPTSCTVDSGTQITARFPAGLRTNGALGWNVRVTNSVGTNATSAVKLVPRAGLLISEVMVGGNGVSDDREFIELYNPTAHPLDVAMLGLQLHVRSFNGTDTTLPLAFSTSTIPSHGFLLLVSSTSNASDLWFARRNATYATSTAQLASNGGAYISLSAVPDGKVLDKLGWGLQSAPGFEGTPVSNITANTSAQRKPASGAGAAFDTDTNSTDFLTPSTSITPKGAADPLEP
ncbi:MAG TPA: lamin tail domain-containing protein, partial [Kofleriaceae bacterium]|nr:lamin tail domain-containing protein [Kofleriaceae bacterium]